MTINHKVIISYNPDDYNKDFITHWLGEEPQWCEGSYQGNQEPSFCIDMDELRYQDIERALRFFGQECCLVIIEVDDNEPSAYFYYTDGSMIYEGGWKEIINSDYTLIDGKYYTITKEQ